MAAYVKGKLEWNVAKVTYWFKGKKLGKPRHYNPRYLRRLMKKHGNPKKFGYWVEGVSEICSLNTILRSFEMLIIRHQATGPGSVKQLQKIMTQEKHRPRVQFPDPNRLKSTGEEVQRRRCMYFEGKGPKSPLANCETIEY